MAATLEMRGGYILRASGTAWKRYAVAFATAMAMHSSLSGRNLVGHFLRGEDLKQTGDWKLDIDPQFGSCVISADYANGEKLVVTYNHNRAIVKVGFTDKYASSFAIGTNKILDFYLFHGDDLKLFSDLRFTALDTTDGRRLIMSGNMGISFFADLLGKDSIFFWFNGQPVASFGLVGFDYQLTQLRKCSVKASRMQTVDPFAR